MDDFSQWDAMQDALSGTFGQGIVQEDESDVPFYNQIAQQFINLFELDCEKPGGIENLELQHKLSQMGTRGSGLSDMYAAATAEQKRYLYNIFRVLLWKSVDIELPQRDSLDRYIKALLRVNRVSEEEVELTAANGAAIRLRTINERIGAVREEMGRELQESLNAYFQTQQPTTFEDRQKIVDIINYSISRLGLAIKYQGQICNFAVTTGGRATAGRFLLVPRGSRTPLLTRVNLSDFLPLELTDANAKREPFGEWQEREQARRGGGRRGGRTD
jgi:hypothetical protein